MQIGLNLPVVHPDTTPGLLRDISRRAEDLGFAELWLGEHVVLFDDLVDAYPGSDDGDMAFPTTLPIPDPLVGHTFVAACTERVRLGTGVLLLPQRNPVYTAKHVATLDWCSGGRLDLGIGIGWSSQEFAALGVPFEARGARCDEYVEVMKTLWCDEVSSHEGPMYTLAACRQYPKPVQEPHPPLWFGGWSDAAMARVARLGSGWYGFDLLPDAIAERLGYLGRLLEESGRSMAEISVASGAMLRAPKARRDLAAYEAVGVQQFVFSLSSARTEDMADELVALARQFVDPAEAA